MAIWPSDDPAIPLAIRRAIFPELGAYSPNEIDFVKRSEPEAGPGHGQVLDVWGRTRFVADITIRARNKYAGIVMAFWRAQRLNTFTFFDQDQDYHEEIVIGNTLAGANQVYALPFKDAEAADSVLYVNNAVIAQPGNWQINQGYGAEQTSALQIIYSPGAGLPIKMHVYGRRRYVCEFLQPPQRSSVGVGQKTITFTVREY